MKKLLYSLIAIFITFGVRAQTFTPIHNYQAPDGLEVIKHLGIPYGDTATYIVTDSVRVGGIPRKSAVLFFQTSDSTLYIHYGKWIRFNGGSIITNSGVDSITYRNSQLCQWVDGVSTCYFLNKFYDSTALNHDSTKILYFNTGHLVDSVLIPVGTIHIIQDGAGETHIVRVEDSTQLNFATLKNSDDITASKNADSSISFNFTNPHYTKDQVDSIAATLTTSGIIDPLLVTWTGAGLDFDISAGSFIYKNVTHYVTASSVTLDAADATYPRIDAFYVDTLGNTGKITGVPAANPVAPQVTYGQFLLTTVQIDASATTPTNVNLTDIYLENTEWTTSKTGTGTVDFNDATNPYSGSKDIKVSGASAGLSLVFTDPSAVDTANIGDVLKLFLYTATPLTSGYTLQFFSGTNPVSYPLSINAIGFGYNPATLSAYQNISVPLSAFTFTSPLYTTLKITAIGANANPVYFDNIQIQKGMYQYTPTDYSNKVDSVTNNSGNLYYWAKGSQHLIGVNGSSGGITQSQLDDSTAAIRADFPSGGKDSGAIHIGYITVAGDTSVVFSDLKGNSDTVSISLLQFWNKNGSRIYYNEGNVGIGTDTANSLLTIQSAVGSGDFDVSKGVLLQNNNLNEFTPSITFESKRQAGVNPVKDVKFVMGMNNLSSSIIAGTWVLNSVIDGVSTTRFSVGANGDVNTGSVVASSFISGATVANGNGTTSNIITASNNLRAGAGPDDPAAIFKINSTTRGFLPSVLTQSQRDGMALTVTSITITNGGSGYTTAPTVNFSTAGSTTRATGTANMSGGVVTSITITNPGYYSSVTPSITFSGGGGTGAAATATMTQVITPGITIFCSDCTATDSSTGVMQTYNGTSWKNNW